MRRLAVMVMVLAQGSGCSFIGVRGPASRGNDCTSTYTLPIVDTVMAAAAATASIATYVSVSGPCEECITQDIATGLVVVPAAVLAGAYAVSAMYGYPAVADCRESLSASRSR